MSEIVFLLEEPSAEAMLDGLLPMILPIDVTHRCIVFDGKQDLEKQMVRRLRGYRAPDAQFVVLRDQDSGDCKEVKKGLVRKCVEANKPDVLVRIVCREIESWYLADLAAVEKGLEETGLARLQNKQPYRAPDSISSPCRKLRELVPSYQKIAGSRAIAPHLDCGNARSRSFRNFIEGVRRICGRHETGRQSC